MTLKNTLITRYQHKIFISISLLIKVKMLYRMTTSVQHFSSSPNKINNTFLVDPPMTTQLESIDLT